MPCPIHHRSYHNKTKLQKVFNMFYIHSHTHITVKHQKAIVESKTSPFPRTVRCTNMIYTHCCVASSFVYFRLHVNFISPTICNLWPTWMSDFSFKRAATRQHLFNCECAIREVQGNHKVLEWIGTNIMFHTRGGW